MAQATTGIRLHVTFEVKDFDKFFELAKKCMEATRKEPGCLHYELFHDIADETKTKLAMIEHWESKEALMEHAKSAHVKEFIEKTKDLAQAEPCLKQYYSCGY
ncbi:hypothetical protein TCAL_12513 [Tigriopus californicus]|uniref:ABM domain-containing protein n=1 Tax=Tigriopus californicus TaxID=6832 RepID=A0A553PHJ7_TIGCA|nr:uncharacterized protein LOC131880097 [Tigriopus californicus]TRY77145.1 hypothetical protein TCAL_12513 [Tigriopus californicus]|eukprot:TCALIF_12513-PA protein Name:"Similar to sll1783 Uncharacterized protein sll1783 (Synechocystis sp. (strain PCC 6803 / Kazusa))" AED:0.12 eAED:0.14 QI:0/-1/0/1/-1/1/1/0/102